MKVADKKILATKNDQARPKRKLPDFVIIGCVTKPHGVRGEFSVYPLTDNPERFKRLKSVFVGNDETHREMVALEHVRVLKREVIVKLAGVETREQAEKLQGDFIEIRREDCLPLENGAHYIFELIGLEVVTQDGHLVGYIEDVIDYPANDVYVVKTETGEALIPVIKDVVKSIDVDQGVVTIDAIDGLLE